MVFPMSHHPSRHYLPSRYTVTTFFTPEHYSPKTDKGIASGYKTGILYLAPARQSGYNVCQNASPGCTRVCLNLAGHGGIGIDTSVLIDDDANANSITRARNARTRMFFERRADFNKRFIRSVANVEIHARETGRLPAVRPNGTSDLPWETMPVAGAQTIMDLYPNVQFYDYTKSARRALANARGQHPSNYHLTFSRSEVNEHECLAVLAAGGNVAVVFAGGILPATWHGYKVVNGDKHDLRFLDPRGVVVGLTAKGPLAKRDTSGFVVQTTDPALAYA